MVGRLFTLWEGPFSGVNFRGVYHRAYNCEKKNRKKGGGAVPIENRANYLKLVIDQTDPIDAQLISRKSCQV